MNRSLSTLLCLIVCTLGLIIPRTVAQNPEDTRSLFATIQSEKSPLFISEPFSLVLSIYSSQNLARNFQVNSLPDSKQFEITKIESLGILPPNQSRTGKHTVRRFRVHAYAATAGTVKVEITIDGHALRRHQTPIGTTTFREGIRINVDPIHLIVQPIPRAPSGKTASGAVGTFTMNVSVTPTNVAPGDLVTVITRLSGKGNISTVTAPSLMITNNFKVYPTETLDDNDAGTLLTYSQTLIPQDTESSLVPGSEFTYFDTKKSAYVTLQSPPVPLDFYTRVDPVRHTPAAATISPSGSVPGLADLRPTKRHPAHWSDNGSLAFSKTPLFLAGLLFPACVVFALAIVRRKKLKRISLPVSLLLAAFLSMAFTTAPPHAILEVFDSATRAHETGRYNEALLAYQDILDRGFQSGALHYNIGNAHLQSGKPAEAIAAYTRALTWLPRDTDLAQNLSRARQLAGLRLTHPDEPYSLPLKRTHAEWLLISCLAYWGLCIVVALILVSGKTTGPPAALASILALLSIGGTAITFQGHQLFASQTAVLVQSQPQRFVPNTRDDGQLEVIPAGHLVQIVDSNEKWARVNWNNTTIWVEKSALERIRNN